MRVMLKVDRAFPIRGINVRQYNPGCDRVFPIASPVSPASGRSKSRALVVRGNLRAGANRGRQSSWRVSSVLLRPWAEGNGFAMLREHFPLINCTRASSTLQPQSQPARGSPFSRNRRLCAGAGLRGKAFPAVERIDLGGRTYSVVGLWTSSSSACANQLAGSRRFRAAITPEFVPRVRQASDAEPIVTVETTGPGRRIL